MTNDYSNFGAKYTDLEYDDKSHIDILATLPLYLSDFDGVFAVASPEQAKRHQRNGIFSTPNARSSGRTGLAVLLYCRTLPVPGGGKVVIQIQICNEQS